MAVDYQIKAHPTRLQGRVYRSRLEAKWAAFFEKCGWPFEYEPFDLPGWSPDFLLGGDISVLVEVKPITAIDNDVVTKMVQAAAAAEWPGELLLVGTSPIWRPSYDCGWDNAAVGYLVEPCALYGVMDWASPIVGPAPVCAAENGMPDFHSDTMAWCGRIFGLEYRKNRYCYTDAAWLKELWNDAVNQVQWKPPHAT
jgi:hypothetical protein